MTNNIMNVFKTLKVLSLPRRILSGFRPGIPPLPPSFLHGPAHIWSKWAQGGRRFRMLKLLLLLGGLALLIAYLRRRDSKSGERSRGMLGW